MSTTANVTALLTEALNEGSISPTSFQSILAEDLGPKIQAALGVNVDSVQASEVILVTQMPDDSGSIRYGNNAQAVRDGHNLVYDALLASKQNNGVLAHTRYLNGHILFPYVPLDQVVRMDSNNYNPSEGTPLYDQTVVLLGTVLTKAQDFSQNGVPVRTVTLITTDGHDEHSVRHTASSVRPIVEDMLMQETHIIAAMGIDDGRTDFRRVFTEMGIRPEWILTPGNNESDIRKAFMVFSRSAVRASQNAASFSKTSLGGFAN